MIESLESVHSPVLLAATVASGLQAGTYYTWACAVMPGLTRSDDATFVRAVQHVNVAIVNPVFLATFVGAPVLAAAGVAVAGDPARPWAIAGLVLAAATVAVTAAANVPLNDTLAAVDADVDAGAGAAALASARRAFEGPWTAWNIARTLTSTGALGCLGWALSR